MSRVGEDVDFSHDAHFESAPSTTSLTPSITNFPVQFGRTYHAYRAGRYPIPNDDKECLRQEMIHQLVKEITGVLYHAPIDNNVQRVLDVGTGTGSWAIEFGDMHPSAEVIGNDLSPNQSHLVPPNVEFIVDDAEDDWLYEDRQFDFVHCRNIGRGVQDMGGLVAQAFKCTKPGGWVEFSDWDMLPYGLDGTVGGTPVDFGCRTVYCVFHHWGYYTNMTADFARYLKDAGFTGVHRRTYPVPMGAWSSDPHYQYIGQVLASILHGSFQSSSMAILSREGWRQEQIDIFCDRVRKSIADPNVHALFDYHVFTAQKPFLN